MGDLVRHEGAGVVGAELVGARTLRRGAVEVAGNHGGSRTQVGAVVGARRGAHDGQDHLRIRHQLHLRMRCEEQRTQVQRSLVAVGRQELEVVLDAKLTHLDKHLLGRLGQSEETGGTGHTGGVLIRTEHDDAAVLLGESLQALEAGNGVVQSLRERVDGEREGLGGLDVRPCAVPVVSQDHSARTVGVEA